jgi:biopolymer transport protein TolR
MSFSTGSSSQTSEINVTPLIDVLLVLLIIFMVLVPLHPVGLPALIPQPAPHTAVPPPPNPDTIVVEAHSGLNGAPPTYAINRQPVARQDLAAHLAAIFMNRTEKVMFVEGDADLQFNSVAEVIAFAHQARVFDIGILTPKIESGQ